MWGGQGWNQWALQPAMFNDVPHEQIDWAALAKQWIQMQQTQPADPSAPPVLPPVPPPSVTTSSIIHPPPPGHGPLVPEEFPSDVPVSAPLLKTPVGPAGIPEPFSSDGPFESEPGGFIQKSVNNAYWNKSQWEESAAGDIDERLGWSAPPIEPASSLIAGKETYDYGHMHDNPPLAMQSIDYNHMSEFSYNQPYPPETPYDQYWSQVNAAPPPISPMFLKKEHSSSTTTSTNASLPVEEDTSQIDAAKRKQLPAWIREGLEKMEQERIKKLEKEKAEKEKAEKLAQAKLKKDLDLKDEAVNPLLVKSKFDSDSEAEAEPEEDNVNTEKIVETQKRSPSPVEDFRTEEEKTQEHMLQLRRILTEILLSVTNAEMYAIAEEVLQKERLKARQLASTASLTSVASGLRSLANYGTDSEASEAEEDKDATDSDEELYRRIKEKKKAFAIKQKKILAELERKELEEQNEALKHKNENKFVSSESEEPENKDSESCNLKEESELVTFVTPLDGYEQSNSDIPFPEEKNIDNPTEATCIEPDSSKELVSNNKGSHSSNSSSSSSESGSESSEKHKKKLDKPESPKQSSDKSKESKKERSPSKKHRHKSSDSDSSDRQHKSRRYDESSKKSSSYKKKKKYKRSDSSSSSSGSPRKKKYSSKSVSSRNHSRDRRSHSYDDRDRKRRRSISPRNYRSSRDSHRSRDSYSHRHEKDKYFKRDKDEKYYYDYKRSPSPYRRSKLPKKYRSSRSPSSESESSKKFRKTRTR